MLSAAMVGVNSVPSAQDTPSFNVNVTVEPWTFQSLASWDRMAPDSGSTATSASYPRWLLANSALADGGVRHVHAVVGLEVDQAVALVVDELLALRLLAELLEQALRDLLHPDPAVVVLADGEVGDLGGVGAGVPARVDALRLGRRDR